MYYNKCLNISHEKWNDPGSLKASSDIFLGLKNMKKGYMEMTKKIYLETLRSALGWSISL